MQDLSSLTRDRISVPCSGSAESLSWFFLTVVGLCCSMWAFPSCGKWGLLVVAVCGLLIAVAALPAEHKL